MSTQELFNHTTCYINGEKKSGKVLAVSTSADQRRVCFLISGEKIGRWVPELALSQEASPPPLSMTPSAEMSVPPEKKDPPISDKKSKKSAALPSPTPSPSIDEPGNSTEQNEAKKNAGKDINALVKFVDDVNNIIQKKANNDIELAVKHLQDILDSIQKTTQVAVETLTKTDSQIQEWIQQSLQATAEVFSCIQTTVNELWNRYWRDRIINVIQDKGFDLEKSLAVVKKLKQDYPHESNRDLASRLVHEKALFVTLTGLLSGIPIANQVINLFEIAGLFTEMINQIAFIYGFDQPSQGELLAIHALVFDQSKLKKLGLNVLSKANIAAEATIATGVITAAISAVAALILFEVVGYVAIEFYENKSNQVNVLASSKDFLALEAKTTAYLEEMMAKEAALEATIVEAVAIKESLPIG